MKKLFCILLALVILSTFISTALGASYEYGMDDPAKPMQSETEFVVALDPEYAEQVLSGQAELFIYEEKEMGFSTQSTSNGNSNHKKIPPGLLKKEFEGKDVHIRNIERYKARHIEDAPVLIVVEVEDSERMMDAREAVELCEGVLYTDTLAYFYADDFNDPRTPEQWGLIPTDAYDAWYDNSLLSEITIAIVDSGVRMSHEDLSASIVPGWDFIGNDPNPTDENGHGTHVAGIAAAISGNGIGIASPAGGAKIMPIRVLNGDGKGDVIGVSDGIRYAVDHGADIINLSLGGTETTVTLRNAVNYALNNGCLVVASAGNENSSVPNYPACYDGVIIAASISVSPNPEYAYVESYFSNYNANYAYRTIHAPGENILSTHNSSDSSYLYRKGTSMAAPFICGIAAAIMARGNYSSSLYEALLDATVTLPRALLDSSGKLVYSVSGDMNVLNDDGHMGAPDQDPPTCRIGQTMYATLAECLAAAKNGDTIVLLSDILYREAMSISNKKLVFDLNGHTLEIVCEQETPINGTGLYVENGEIRCTGDGELNVMSAAMSGFGLYAVNSIVEITNALGTNNSYGVRAEQGSQVTVFGIARGATGVYSCDDSSVTVYGDVIGIYNEVQTRSQGVNAYCAEVIVFGDVVADDAISAQEGGNVTVYGDVYGGDGYNSSGIRSIRSNVAVHGNVTTGLAGVYCAGFEAGASVTILGNLTCTHPSAIGIEMPGNGISTVTIDGKVKSATFAKLISVIKNPSDITTPTTKTGYTTYKETNGAAIATLWVKERENAEIKGKVSSYNPQEATTITLFKAGSVTEIVASTEIEALATGYGQVTRSFSLFDIPAGIYDLVITKGGHLSYKIIGIAVEDDDIDLTADTTKAYSIITLLAGDIDGDGLVSTPDLTLLLNSFGKPPTSQYPYADISCDGIVSTPDLTILLNNFGKKNENCFMPY